jgi:hypothetical protein
LLAILVYYLYSAARISSKFNDWSAMRLFVLYFVRVFAWISGAASAVASYLGGGQKK